MRAPRWFERELKAIDSTYFAVFNKKYHYYEIKKEMNVVRDGKLVVVKPTLAVFRRLNETSLNNLRERKYMGRKYAGDPMKYLNYLNSLNVESKKKKQKLALETMTEGYMRIHNLGRKKIFT